MASKTNMTSPDDDHVQFGNEDHFNTTGLPSWFNGGSGDFEFCPQYFGRVMVNPNNAGFGSAFIDPEDRYVEEDE